MGALESNGAYVWESSGEELSFFNWLGGVDPGVVPGTALVMECTDGGGKLREGHALVVIGRRMSHHDPSHV